MDGKTSDGEGDIPDDLSMSEENGNSHAQKRGAGRPPKAGAPIEPVKGGKHNIFSIQLTGS